MGVPSEIQFPIKSAPSHVAGGDVFECLVADDVNDWADDGFAVVGNAIEEGLQPSGGALAVSVQKRDHLAFHVLCAEQSRPDQS